MLAIQVFELDTADRRRARQFLDLPFAIYRAHPQWVPPLAADAARMLDRRRHPFYSHSDAAFFLALDAADQPVGRLAVLDNRRYNEYNHERTAFFYLFECADDLHAAVALFDAGCAWARRRGLDKLLGPKGFSALDGQGLLVRGFEHRPALGIPYNPPYYPRLLEAAGLQPLDDVVSGYLSRDAPFPARIHEVAERVRQRRGLEVVRFRSRRQMAAMLPRLQAMYNDAITGTSGNVPLTDAEARAMFAQLLWFVDPSLVKIVLKDDEPVGFLLAYPDISAAVQRTRGRFFPFGWLRLLLELRRTAWLNINGAAIVEKYRGLGGTALLFSEMHKTVAESRFRHVDIVQVGAGNDAMQRELAGLGIDFYKAHRLYTKPL